MDNNLTIWRDIAIIKEKGKKVITAVPLAVINGVTHKLMPVMNTRGWGYVFRRSDRYRKNRRKT